MNAKGASSSAEQSRFLWMVMTQFTVPITTSVCAIGNSISGSFFFLGSFGKFYSLVRCMWDVGENIEAS